MDYRIATYLLQEANNTLRTVRITHEAIANELGSSREVVSRILKTFEKRGILSLARGKIKVDNWKKLEEFAKLGNL